METLKQRRLNYEKIKTDKDCTEKKEIINSKKYETLLKKRSNQFDDVQFILKNKKLFTDNIIMRA